MTKKLLMGSGVVIIILAAFALGWFVAARFGFGPTGLGMMGYGGYGMHPGMMGGFGPGFMRGAGFFGWGGMLFAGGLRLLGWLFQIAVIAAIVAWLIKPRAAAQVNSNPSQVNQQ